MHTVIVSAITRGKKKGREEERKGEEEEWRGEWERGVEAGPAMM